MLSQIDRINLVEALAPNKETTRFLDVLKKVWHSSKRVRKKTMTTVNTVELKSQANRLLDRVAKHQIVLITRRGLPCAALIPVSGDTLVDLLWEYSPEVQRRLRVAMKELQGGKTHSLHAFAQRHGLA